MIKSAADQGDCCGFGGVAFVVLMHTMIRLLSSPAQHMSAVLAIALDSGADSPAATVNPDTNIVKG